MVIERNEDLILLRVVCFKPPEEIRAFIFRQWGGELNELAFEDISVLRNLPVSHGLILGIALHAGDKIESVGDPLAKEAVII